jgi:hypothetical protein
VFSVTDSFVTETRARFGDDSVDYKRLVQKYVEFVLNLNFGEFWGSLRRKGLFLIPRGMK